MKSRVRLEKYINFSLISNCIIFNTLAGCGKGKDKKGGGGCSGSGKDKEPVIIGEGKNEQSAEELAKKKKEAEEKAEKEKKAKEEAAKLAEKLAKDKAALDEKKQELITKLKGLKSRIESLNACSYTDLHITDIVSEDEIKSADAEGTVKIEKKINDLETKISENETKLKNYKTLKDTKNNEFYTKFKDLDDKMNIINNLDGCSFKVKDNVVNRKDIDDCKFEDIDKFRKKFLAFEKEIDYIFAKIKQDLLDKKKKIDVANKNTSHLLNGKLNVKFNDEAINNCTFENLNEIFNDINQYYNLSQLKSSEVGNYFEKEFKKIENVYNFFVWLGDTAGKKAKLEDNKKSIDNVINDKTGDEKEKVNKIKDALKCLINLKTILDNLITTYNRKYKERRDNTVKNNEKLNIELKYENEEDDGTGKKVMKVYYEKKIDKKYEIKDSEISDDIITINYSKTLDDLKAIETKVKKLENNVKVCEEQFKKEIEETCDLLKDIYSGIDNEITLLKLDNKNTETYKNSLNALFNKIKTSLNNTFDKVDKFSNINKVISEALRKNLIETYKIFTKEDITAFTLDSKFSDFSNYFYDGNTTPNGDIKKTIKDNINKLQEALKECDIAVLSKKIYEKIKILINKYAKAIEDDASFFGFKRFYPHVDNIGIFDFKRIYYDGDSISLKYIKNIGKIIFKKNFKVDDGRNIELDENYFYQVKELPDAVVDINFNVMNLILNNFKKLFDYNAGLIKKVKGGWNDRIEKIKEIGYDFCSISSGEKAADFTKSLKELVENFDLSSYDFFTNFETFVDQYNSKNYKLSDFPNKLKDTVKKYADLVGMKDIDKQYIYCGREFNKIKKKNDFQLTDDFIEFFSLFFDEIMYKMLITKFFISFTKSSENLANLKGTKDDILKSLAKFYHDTILGYYGNFGIDFDFRIDFNQENLNHKIEDYYLLDIKQCFKYFYTDTFQKFFKDNYHSDISGCFNYEITKSETE